MRNVISLICLLFFLQLKVLSQQIKQAGYITFQNSKNKPVVGAQIKALWANPQLSNATGKFELTFVGKSPGTEVEMTIDYAGYEVVNKKELNFNLNPEKAHKFYLCKIGEWENNALAYYSINKEKILKEYNEKYKKLTAKNIHLIDSLTVLERQKTDALKSLKELSELFAKINLDDANDLFNEAFLFFKKGDINSAIKVLDAAKLTARLEDAVKKKNEGIQLIEIGQEKKVNAETAIKDYIGLCRSTAQLCVAGYKYNEAKKYYELAIKYDSSNVDYMLQYAQYLYHLNDSAYLTYTKKGISGLSHKYDSLTKSQPFTDSSYTLLFLLTSRLTNAHDLLDNYMISKRIWINIFDLFEQIASPNAYSYQLRAKICSFVAAMNFKNEDFYGRTLNYAKRDSLHAESRAYLNFGWKIIDSLSNVNLSKTDSIACIISKKSIISIASLFNLHSGKREIGLHQLLQAIELGKKIFEIEKDTSEYLQSMAADYSRLDLSYRSLDKVDSALYARRVQVSYARQLVSIDSTYYEDYIAAMEGIPSLLDELKQYDSSNYYRHLILKEYQDLAKRNPYKYLANIAERYLDLAEWWTERNVGDSLFKYYKISCARFDTLSMLAPPRYLGSYSRALADYGYRLLERKDYKLAEMILKKALHQSNQLIRNYDSSVYSYKNKFIISNNLGDLYFTVEKYDTALHYYVNVLKDIVSIPEKDSSI